MTTNRSTRKFKHRVARGGTSCRSRVPFVKAILMRPAANRGLTVGAEKEIVESVKRTVNKGHDMHCNRALVSRLRSIHFFHL